MPTPRPLSDFFNPYIQKLLEEFERKYLPVLGLAGEHGNVKRIFGKFGHCPLISDLMGELLSGEWKIGTTQGDVGESLGLERSRVSDAHRRGEMTLATYLSVRYAEFRPRNPEPTQETIDAMNRAGFMGVAQFFGGFVHDRQGLLLAELNEARHELLCEMLGNYPDWLKCRLTNDGTSAAGLITRVCGEKGRGIVPEWYSDKDVARVKAEVKQWTSSPARALKFLRDLQDNWEDIYVATAQATEEGQGVCFALQPLKREGTP